MDLVFERRALLFDLGHLARVAPRKLSRVSDVSITHRHMDHFAGFDQLLRRLLGREKIVGLYGPAGLIDAVEHKLEAYSWNLIEGYSGNLVFRITEVDDAGYLTSAQFSGRRRFERTEIGKSESSEGLLLREPASKFVPPRSIMACPHSLSHSRSGHELTYGATRSRPWD